MTATYVYGLTRADTTIPEEMTGLGASGHVSTITHRQLAAIVSDLPSGRQLGTREDLLAHEAVIDTLARSAPVLPMRFAAVMEDADVVGELLAPHHDRFATALAELGGSVQYTLRGSYAQDAVLRELVADHPEIRELRQQVSALPEEASYALRVRLGELIVRELERRRDGDADAMLDRLEPVALDLAVHEPGSPDEVIRAAFLVARADQSRFEHAVEDLGRDLDGRVHLKLFGPLAPYDFVPEG